MEKEFYTYTIEITGELPLEIEGELLYQNNNYHVNGKERNRYHGISVYHAIDEDGEYWVVNIQFETCWQGERSISEAWEVDSKDEIKGILDTYDPVLHLIGYPDTKHFADKQKKLIKELTLDWKELRVDCLNDLGFKRTGRKRLGRENRVSVNLTLDPALLSAAREKNINLSQTLSDRLEEMISAVS